MNNESPLVDHITEISARRTALNAGAAYGRYGLAMVLGIILQGYVIRALGRDEYALWPLILTCLSFASVIPVGIGSGTGRFLAHALGRKDVREVEQITTSLFVALSVGALLYTAAVVMVSLYFERIFDLPEGTNGIGPPAMLLAGMGGAIALPFGVFSGGLQAAQQFVVLNVLGVLSLAARLLLTVLAFTVSTPSLIWVAGVQLLVTVAENVALFWFAQRLVPWQRIRRAAFSWPVLRQTHGFSLLVLVTTVAGLLYWQVDTIVINKLLDPALVTGYSVVVSFVLYSYQIASLGISVIGPVSTILHARQEIPRLSRLIYRANRIVVPWGACLLGFLMICGREVLNLYLGPGYDPYAILFLILGISGIVSATQVASGLVPQAFGRVSLVAIMSLMAAILNATLSVLFILVCGWALVGVTLGTAVVMIVYKLVFWPWYTAAMLRVPVSEYVWRTVILPLADTTPFLAIVLVAQVAGCAHGWVGLAATFLLASAGQAAYVLGWSLETTDRARVKAVGGRCLSLLKLTSRESGS
jgi:O-antigen/teichoic acid export membrane protein